MPENEREEQEPMGMVGEAACRMNAKAVLEEKIRWLEKEKAALETLRDAIPWKILTKENEELLWRYFSYRH